MKNVYPFSDKETISEEAAAWLIRLDQDQPLDRKSKSELREWMGRSPLHKKRLTQLSVTWNKLNKLAELSVPIDHQTKFRWNLGWLAPRSSIALASLALMSLGLVLLFAYFLSSDTLHRTNGVYATAIGQNQQVTLADGSTLQLNTNTMVNVVYDQGYRDIHLMQGEAYFQVAKDKQRPFRVFAGQGRVQAIGTAFVVYLKDNTVAVSVEEGQVALASINGLPPKSNPSSLTKNVEPGSGDKNLGYLTAGQGATLRTKSSTDSHISVDEIVLDDLRVFRPEDLQRHLSWRQGLLVFNGESLEQVVEEISRYTTMNIDIPDADVRKIKLGGQLEVGDTEMMLEALEDVFALKIIRTDNKVLILAGDNWISPNGYHNQ